MGYEEGRNIHLDWRNLRDEAAAREVANEFVRNRVDLIVAFENQTARAAKAATSDIPIVKFSSLMIRLASEKRLPLVGHRKEWVERGALFSYAHDLASVGPAAARYIDRIFKGTGLIGRST